MDSETLVTVDAYVARLAPGRREAVREIVVDAVRRGYLPSMNRRALITATGSPDIADILEVALRESAAGAANSDKALGAQSPGILSAARNADAGEAGRAAQ